MVRSLPKVDAGLVRTMDKTLQGTWMAKKRRQEPMIRVRGLIHRRKGKMQVGGMDVDDEWVSKLHKHLWELQGIWKGLKEYVDVLAKYGIIIPLWTWVSFSQVMGIVIKISRVADEVEKR